MTVCGGGTVEIRRSKDRTPIHACERHDMNTGPQLCLCGHWHTTACRECGCTTYTPDQCQTCEDSGEERWLPVVGYEGYYEVSNFGRIRSIDREIIRPARSGGFERASIRGRMMKQKSHPLTGHQLVNLSRDGKQSCCKVHRVVLEAFVGPPSVDRPLGLHWNDDVKNNRLENLRWGNDADNRKDRIRNGRDHYASRTHCTQGHEYTMDNIYRLSGNGRRCKKCFNEYQRQRRRASARI